MARQNHKQKYKGENGTEGYEEHHQEEKTAVARSRVVHGHWTRIEEPNRYCIGFLREERDEEDRGRTGQRSL